MKSICIIGSGLGGLTAGALLAKKNYKVTIVEQHYSVGGAATIFKRKGIKCEVGLHEMDDAFGEGTKKKIFEELGVYDNVDFVKAPEFFKLVTDKIEFTMPDGIEEAKSALKEKFPDSKSEVDKYFKLIESISKEFKKVVRMKKWQLPLFPFLYPNIFKFKSKSVQEVLNGFIKDEELKLVLNTNVGYYSDFIDNLSFLYHALGQISYYRGGGWYIKGGSQNLSNYLAKVITDNGGEIIMKSDVFSVKKDGDAFETFYKNTKGEFSVKSDILLSNISPMRTYKMLGMEVENKLKVASSLLTVYMGFDVNLKEKYGKKEYSTFFMDKVNSMDDYNNSLKKDIEDRGFVFVDYSQVDSQLCSDDKSFAVCCATDNLSEWDNLTKEEYHAKKDKLTEAYLTTLEKHYPEIRSHILFMEVGTARTMQEYLRTENGTAYGFAATPKQFFKSPKSRSEKVEGLYFTGAWVIGGGFSTAINSGGLAYKTILKDNKAL